MLFGERKRLEKLAKSEAAGKSFWTTKFSAEVRIKLVHLFRDVTGDFPDYFALSRALILRSQGKLRLTNDAIDEASDLLNYLLNGDDDSIPDIIEAMHTACETRQIMARTHRFEAAEDLARAANRILLEHRLSYELVNGQMVELASRELHQAVVSPAVTLLAGRPDLHKVEQAYMKALGEISNHDAADAITDAGTALQEMLNALGCKGGALGDLIKSAKSKSLLARHDSPMLEAIERIMRWVSADRSETGDAHKASSPDLEDAWFMVHIVGVIILRLSGSPRTSH